MPFLKPVDPCQDSVAQAPGSPDRAGFARSGVETLLPVPVSRADGLREPQDTLHHDAQRRRRGHKLAQHVPEARLRAEGVSAG